MDRLNGFVEAGNTTLVIAGASGTIARKVQGSYPSATIEVFAAGTVNLSTIYSDDGVTSKANPFVAGADGTFFFYAANGRYDVRFSAGGISTPFTIGDFVLFDQADLALTSVTRANLPTPATLGKERVVSDDVGGLFLAQGAQWVHVGEERVNVRWKGAIGDGVASDQTPIQNAINTADVVVFPPRSSTQRGIYNVTGLTLKRVSALIGTHPDSAVINYTPATGDCVTIPDIANVVRPVIENLTLQSTGASSGWGISHNTTDPTHAPRDLLVRHCLINDFANGIRVINGLDTLIDHVRMTLKGKLIAGSIGILLGSDALGGNGQTISNCYLSTVETCLQTKSFGALIQRVIAEACINGYEINNRTTVIEPWIQSDAADFIIRDSGTLSGSAVIIGNPRSAAAATVTYGAENNRTDTIWIPSRNISVAPVRVGRLELNNSRFSITRVTAYRSGVQSLSSGVMTKVVLNAEETDERGEWNTTTGTFTREATNLPNGWVDVQAQVAFNNIPANTLITVEVRKNGTAIANGQVRTGGGTANSGTVSTAKATSISTGDTIELWAQQDSGGALDVSSGATLTFIDIHARP